MAHDFDFTLDNKKYENNQKKLTANQILEIGGFDLTEYYLVEIVGEQHDSFQNHGEQVINLKQENKFITVYFGTKDFPFRVDGEEYLNSEKKLTANQILVKAGFDPTQYYLVELEGKKHHSYQNEGDKQINLKKENDFVTVYTGPTTVSFEASGQRLFADQLTKMGYIVNLHGDNELSFDYYIEVGKYAGQTIKHGLVVDPSFPATPPTGPHVYSSIHPHQGGGVHPTGGVHPSEQHSQSFKTGWQYWSRPCSGWGTGPKSAAAYLAFIRGLWATQ